MTTKKLSEQEQVRVNSLVNLLAESASLLPALLKISRRPNTDVSALRSVLPSIVVLANAICMEMDIDLAGELDKYALKIAPVASKEIH